MEPITTDEKKFRITNYSPDYMAQAHHRGTHKYCIAKDVFDYEVIITVPKLKTHRMAGMTNSLKILIGINGDKEFLPHHRIGSKAEGGDCYKDKSWLRKISDVLRDSANRHVGSKTGHILTRLSAAFWKLSRPDQSTLTNAGWYGNDTIWRTVLDINKIAIYGDGKGSIHSEPQRKLYTLVDGIIGGQGDGPLHPIPSPLGFIGFSNCPYLMDVVAANLYHINIDKVPLLKEAYRIIANENNIVRVGGIEKNYEEVRKLGIDIQMSPGWVHYND